MTKRSVRDVPRATTESCTEIRWTSEATAEEAGPRPVTYGTIAQQATECDLVQSLSTNERLLLTASPALAMSPHPAHDKSCGPEPPKLLHVPDESRAPAEPVDTKAGRTQASPPSGAGSTEVLRVSSLAHIRLAGN